MLEYPLISTIQTLEKEDKKLLSLWLSSFFTYKEKTLRVASQAIMKMIGLLWLRQ